MTLIAELKRRPVPRGAVVHATLARCHREW